MADDSEAEVPLPCPAWVRKSVDPSSRARISSSSSSSDKNACSVSSSQYGRLLIGDAAPPLLLLPLSIASLRVWLTKVSAAGKYRKSGSCRSPSVSMYASRLRLWPSFLADWSDAPWYEGSSSRAISWASRSFLRVWRFPFPPGVWCDEESEWWCGVWGGMLELLDGVDDGEGMTG